MIVSKLPPSRFSGAVGTPIHTDAFRCFVSTTRRSFLSAQWDTLITNGDPGVDPAVTPCARLFYPKKFRRDDIYKLHDATCELLNEMGESGKSLDEAASRVVRVAIQNGIERVFENYVSRGRGMYLYDVLERPDKHD